MNATVIAGPWARMGAAHWTAQQDKTSFTEWRGIGPKGDKPLVLVVNDGRLSEADFEAVTKLVEAAPDLLEAAELALTLIIDIARYVDGMGLTAFVRFNEAPIKLSWAIAKAKGASTPTDWPDAPLPDATAPASPPTGRCPVADTIPISALNTKAKAEVIDA